MYKIISRTLTTRLIGLNDSRLRTPSLPVAADQFGTAELSQLVRRMRREMQREGGCGIAAPQIGVNLRLFIVELPTLLDTEDDASREKIKVDDGESLQAVPFTVCVNPTLDDAGGEDGSTFVWESCLSVPGKVGLVPRRARVAMACRDLLGRRVRVEATGFHAAMLQHEVDHLDGVLYTDRIPPERAEADLYDAEGIPPERAREGTMTGTWKMYTLS